MVFLEDLFRKQTYFKINKKKPLCYNGFSLFRFSFSACFGIPFEMSIFMYSNK